MAQGAGPADVASDTANDTYPLLERFYARYLAGGRGDVQVHLSTEGVHASARTRPNGDGSFSCHVFGLRAPPSAHEPERAQLLLAATLVHEATHCQTTPYAAGLRQDDADPADPVPAAINNLLLLTLESISDARVVIEFHRRDGAQAARTVVATMLPARRLSASLGHSTAAALHEALELVTRQPAAVHDDAQAFAAALHIGRHSALRTLQRFAHQRGHAEVLQAPAFRRAVSAIENAMARAHDAFRTGRFENNAATFRSSNDTASSHDYHFFVGKDGHTHTEPVVSAEGAHSVTALRTLIASSDAPEHHLAIQWLQREGLLDATSLARARAALGGLIRSFSDGSPAQNQRVTAALAAAIRQSRKGEGLSAVLENAADELKPSGFDGTSAAVR